MPLTNYTPRTEAAAKKWRGLIGASLSEPYTSELNCGIFIYIHIYLYIYICRTSFCKCKLTLLTRNIAHTEFKCGQNIEKNTWSTLPYSSLELSIRLSEFYLHRFRLQVLLPMDTHTSSLRRALKLAQEQEVAEDWRWPRNEKQTELDMLQALRNKGARKWREKGRARHTAQTASEGKLLHSGKVLVNTELRPLRRKKRGTEVQRYCTLNKAISA